MIEGRKRNGGSPGSADRAKSENIDTSVEEFGDSFQKLLGKIGPVGHLEEIWGRELAGGLQWVSETDNLIIVLVLTCCPLTQQRMIGVGAWWVYCPYWPR